MGVNMAWTANDEKNEFKSYTNKLIAHFNRYITNLRRITNYNLDVTNIAILYRNRIFDLEEDFLKHGINFFDTIALRNIINQYFLSLLDESLNTIDRILDKLKVIHRLYLFDKTSILANKFTSTNIKQYDQICSKIISFDIRNDILSALIPYFSNDKYYIFTPGEFTSQYEKVKSELLQLGLVDLIPTIDEKILPLIAKQELASARFNDLKDFKPKTNIFTKS